jgi:hypothetical protein
MLAKAIELADSTENPETGPDDVQSSLVSYCVREAMDSIFPKLRDSRIYDVSTRLVAGWRNMGSQPEAGDMADLAPIVEELSAAFESAQAGFVPRVSLLLSMLNPGIAADMSVPAMARLKGLNRASNASLHGSGAQQHAAELLDGVLTNLVELVAPLAVTSNPYRELIEAGDFAGIAVRLAGSSDPRIRVYLFEEVRDARLAEELDIAELLPAGSFWLGHIYLRRLAAEQPEDFSRFVSRVIAEGRMTSQHATSLLSCACLADASTRFDVERLISLAGPSTPFDLVARWLSTHAGDIPDQSWWEIVSRLVSVLRGAGYSRAPYGLAEILNAAIENLPGVSADTRARFGSAVFEALSQLDNDSSYAIQMYFDHPRRQISTSDLIIGVAVGVLATNNAGGEESDLTTLSESSHAALLQGAVGPSLVLASDEMRVRIAERAFASLLHRISSDEWPVPDENVSLAEVLPLLPADQTSQLDGALGDPPNGEQIRFDLAEIDTARAGWFRLATWAGHLPESFRPARWSRVLEESSRTGLNFGPIPDASYSLDNSQGEPRFDLDATTLSVTDLVERLNAIDITSGVVSSRQWASLHDVIEAHIALHRSAWAEEHPEIARIRNLPLRRAVLSQLRSGGSDLPRLSWAQLQQLWVGVTSESETLQTSGSEDAKAAVAELAREVIDGLRLSLKDRPRSAADVDWWIEDIHPAVVALASKVGESESDAGLPALYSVRGASVRLLVGLSSPRTDDAQRDQALRIALDLVAEAAKSDRVYASSVGYWARWLIARAPEWWEAQSDHLVGKSSARFIRSAMLKSNFASGNFESSLLGVDVNILNSFGAGASHDAAFPILTAVLADIVPVAAIREETWAAIFKDASSTENALRYLFLEPLEEDGAAIRRLGLLRRLSADRSRASQIWRSLDTVARSADISDADFFAFGAELAESNRGKPMSMTGLVDRFTRSLANPDAGVVLEAMLSGNLNESRAMTQYDLAPLNAVFNAERTSIPAELRNRIHTSLFEVGFRDQTE